MTRRREPLTPEWQEALREWVANGALPGAPRRRGERAPTAAQSAAKQPPQPAIDPDRQLWQRWLQEAGVTPLPPRDRAALQKPLPPPHPRQRERAEAEVKEQLLAPLTLDDWLDHDSDTQFLRPGVPRRMLLEMRRGRWTIRRQLDLHGLTREEARVAMSAFLAEALLSGERCVRIIHGKGLGSPGGVSVLKHLSRQWLTRREEILAFCEAAPHQGGSGALLVLLRAPKGTLSSKVPAR